MSAPRVAWGVVSLTDPATGAPSVPLTQPYSPTTITLVMQDEVGMPRRLDVSHGSSTRLFQQSAGSRPSVSSGTRIGTLYVIGFFHLSGSAPTVATSAVTLTGDTLPAWAARVVVDTALWTFLKVEIPSMTLWSGSTIGGSGTNVPVGASKPLPFVVGEPFDADGRFLWT